MRKSPIGQFYAKGVEHMTDLAAETAKGRRIKSCPYRRRQIPFSRTEGSIILLSALLFWFVLKEPTAAALAAREGFSLSVGAVLPSLFPFLVLASLLSESELGTRISRRASRVTEALFGVSGEGAGTLFLGLVCGFPIGARVIMSAYERGTLSSSEVKRLLPLANGPSFAFLFSAVGSGLFGDRSFGLSLYFSSVAATLLCGIILRFLLGKCQKTKPCDVRNTPISLPSLFVRVITDAGKASVTIAAFVVFFSVLSNALTSLLQSVRAPDALSLLLSGLLELSNGTKKAAETVNGLCGRVLCGFFAGWGGLCAHLQVIATVERPLPDRARRKSLSFRSYFLCKILIGLFTAVFVFLSSML